MKSIEYAAIVVIGIVVLAGAFMFASPPKSDIQPANKVRVGVLYPFTGTSSTAGEDARKGIELAGDIVNGEYRGTGIPFSDWNGISSLGGAKIELVFADHKGNSTVAAQETERLIKEEKVVAIIGCYQSSITAAASEKAEELQTPFLNAESSSPDLNKRGFRWFFRTTPDDDIFAENFFTFLGDLSQRGELVPKKIAIVYENSLWGTGVARAEEKNALKEGFEIAENIPYSSKTDNVTSEVESIKASGAGIVMQASYDNDSVLFMKEYKAANFSPSAILGMDAGFVSSSFIKNLKEDSEYVLSREVWALDIGESKKVAADVNSIFRQRYGSDMNGNIARAFTGFFVLAKALDNAGSTEPEALREALSRTKLEEDEIIMPWKGVDFDERNQNTLGRGIIVQVQGGVYKTVWPFELASEEIVWPMPAWSER